MFVRNGAVTPGPSRESDITLFVEGRRKSVQQLRVQRVNLPSSQVTHKCRSPGQGPPLKMPDA